MIGLNKSATKILKRVIEMADTNGGYFKLDNTSGTFIPLVVENIGECDQGKLYSLAHYGELNGDLMADPEVVFIHAPQFEEVGQSVFPVSFTNHYVGAYDEVVIFNEEGKVTGFKQRAQADLASFANDWMRNIKSQQF